MNNTIEIIRARELYRTMTVWNFSPLDRACLPMVIRGTWLFKGIPDVEKMKESLKILLGYYPHLSGRMKDKKGIHLTNEGVPFTVAHDSVLSLSENLDGKNYLFFHF